MNEEKKEIFDWRLTKLETQMEETVNVLNKNVLSIAQISTDYGHLQRSLNSLNTALWGLLGVFITTMVGFFIWYVQKL